MTTLRLRSLSRADIAWRQVMANWRHRGISASLAIPDNNGWLMRVTADDSAWSGVIDGREWLACQLPQLAALAESARDNANTLALFNAMEQPLTFEHNALPYRRLRAQAFTDSASLAANPVPCLSARECAVWITHLANADLPVPARAEQRLGQTPVLIELSVGTSRATTRILNQLALGDVMLITRITPQVICRGRVIGKFWQNEEMIMMEEHDEDYDLTEEFDSTTFGDDGALTENLSGALADVPVKLEFILQARYLAIAEVQALFAGKVMEMDPAAEKKIEIRANGRILARGELVQLEDRLGVEVRELIQESDDAN